MLNEKQILAMCKDHVTCACYVHEDTFIYNPVNVVGKFLDRNKIPIDEKSFKKAERFVNEVRTNEPFIVKTAAHIRALEQLGNFELYLEKGKVFCVLGL